MYLFFFFFGAFFILLRAGQSRLSQDPTLLQNVYVYIRECIYISITTLTMCIKNNNFTYSVDILFVVIHHNNQVAYPTLF